MKATIDKLAIKYQVKASSDAIPALIRVLAQNLGNRRYLNDLEVLLERLEPLTNYDNQTLWYLVRDLKR